GEAQEALAVDRVEGTVGEHGETELLGAREHRADGAALTQIEGQLYHPKVVFASCACALGSLPEAVELGGLGHARILGDRVRRDAVGADPTGLDLALEVREGPLDPLVEARADALVDAAALLGV